MKTAHCKLIYTQVGIQTVRVSQGQPTNLTDFVGVPQNANNFSKQPFRTILLNNKISRTKGIQTIAIVTLLLIIK